MYCVTVAFINLLPFNGDFSFGKSQKSQGAKSGLQGGLADLGDVMLCQNSLHESCRMGRRIVVMKLICSLGQRECDGHTVHKLSQRRLTADLLAPREIDCLRMRSKVSSECLPSYIKATRPVLEIFKMAGYFPDSPRSVRETRRSKGTVVWGSDNVPCPLNTLTSGTILTVSVIYVLECIQCT